MPYLYGITDTKFKFPNEKKVKIEKSPPPPRIFKLKKNPLFINVNKYDKSAVPIQFKTRPASLVEQCVSVVDKLELPAVTDWTNQDVQRWINRYGYPQYRNTFRVNMISGRKLLLIDGDALPAMNIRDFEHIKHIIYGIRMLFHLDLAKHSLDLSLPSASPNELYLLWHTQTGVNYDAVRRSDLFRRMQLICEKSLNLQHWDLLKLWLKREQERKYKVVIAHAPRYRLYRFPPLAEDEPTVEEDVDDRMCHVCMPPCECNWTSRDTRVPWRLMSVKSGVRAGNAKSSNLTNIQNQCQVCVPPCECRWLPRYYLTGTVLSCLKSMFSDKFAPIYEAGFLGPLPPSHKERWTRFSL